MLSNNPLEISGYELWNSLDYIDAEVAASIVEQQYDLARHNCEIDNCNEMDLHFLHGYFRCAADVGVMSEDNAEGIIIGFTKLYEEKGIGNYPEWTGIT